MAAAVTAEDAGELILKAAADGGGELPDRSESVGFL
jgi:hypothetical protein